MKEKTGVAIGLFRMDSGIDWEIGNILNHPGAHKSLTDAVADQKKRMENKGSLTDQVVRDFTGGSRASEYQANAYREVMNNFKNGKGPLEPAGSLAAAARKRMIERDQMRNQEGEEHPDIGRDKADRRAYPKESGTRKDSASEAAARSYAEAGESATAWANAGCR